MFRFGFKSGICLLFAPVPVHCFSITLNNVMLTAVVTVPVFRVPALKTLNSSLACGVIINKNDCVNVDNDHYHREGYLLALIDPGTRSFS